LIQEIESSDLNISVQDAAKSLNVSRSGYYKWRSREPDIAAFLMEEHIKKEIKRIVKEYDAYGYRRITRELKKRGYVMNHKKVLRLMKELHLTCKKNRFKPKTTDSNHEHEVYPNLILHMEITGPNQVWAADITYIRLGNGEFVYLAVIIDIGTRRCLGWDLGRGLDTQLALNALHMALETRNDVDLNGIIHHSDQGVQYASGEYVECLKSHGMQISMSRKGNPYDNAFAESFIKTLKVEEVYMNEYESYEDALKNIGRFIDEMYNKKRMHSALGYRSPIEYEQEVALNIQT